MLHHRSTADPVLILEGAAVRELELEEYLCGVVPAEMPASWPLEALMAQAIAARTYALHSVLHPRHPEAHLCSGPHCQVWNPARRHPRSDEAVRATTGLVLLWEGEPMCTMYSANCGGHTDDGPLPYLRGVPCPAPGPRQGHGLGLCQHGARALAERGLKASDILAHYYSPLPSDPEAGWRALAWAALGQPGVMHGDLARYARAHHLGAPLGPEQIVSLGGQSCRLQPYAGGIVCRTDSPTSSIRHLDW